MNEDAQFKNDSLFWKKAAGWMNEHEKIVNIILFTGLAVLFAITRLWQLTSLPYGLHIDEASMGYTAWCLSEYGVDRYLKSYPVFLKNFWGAQSALYAYLCAILFRIFGYHQFLIRVPGVIFSFLNFLFGMKITKIIYPKNKLMPLITGIMITICPYFIMAGRFGLDCNLMLGVSTVFLYFFITAVEKNQSAKYVLAGIIGGVLLYTYALSYIILPLFLVLSCIYLLRVKRFYIKKWIAMAFPMGIIAFPLILVQIINYFDLPEFKIGCFTITKLDTYRISEIGKISFEKFTLALNSIFLVDGLEYNSAPGHVNLYSITIFLFILGFVSCIIKFGISLKKREYAVLSMILLWFGSVLFFESHISSNTNKINSIFFVTVVIAVEGLYILQRAFRKYSAIPIIIAGCIYFVCFLDFSHYYYGSGYRTETGKLPFFDITVSEAIQFVEDDPILCKKETQMAETETYFALSTLRSPYILEIGERDEHYYENFHMGMLGEIEDRCNYIVSSDFVDFSNQLRAWGFTENSYDDYSLFYKR